MRYTMKKPTIYITRKIPEYLLEPYQEQLAFRMWKEEKKPVPMNVLYEEAAEADGLLCLLTENIDATFIEHASHLKIIANMAVGYDNINVQAATQQGMIITNTPDVLTETTADLTFALLMATARRLIEATSTIKEDGWGDWSPFELAGTDIHHKTIGIVGMGRIGAAVAKRAKGFEMEILYHNRSRNNALEEELAAKYVDFNTLLQQADFVVSLVPLFAETTNLFNATAFKLMKKSAIFINGSRGGVVDEEALYTALKTGEIKAAGLDVFKQEPISSTHPLVQLPNTVLLPHIGSATIATREKMLSLCLENISRVFAGQEPKTPVYL